MFRFSYLFSIVFFLSLSINGKAQSHANPDIKCTIGIEQVVEQQLQELPNVFKDSYEHAKIQRIVEEIFLRLDLFYIAKENDDSESMKTQIEAIDAAIESAALLNLNLEMFKADFDIIALHR